MPRDQRDRWLDDRFQRYRDDFYGGGGERTLDRLRDKLSPYHDYWNRWRSKYDDLPRGSRERQVLGDKLRWVRDVLRGGRDLKNEFEASLSSGRGSSGSSADGSSGDSASGDSASGESGTPPPTGGSDASTPGAESGASGSSGDAGTPRTGSAGNTGGGATPPAPGTGSGAPTAGSAGSAGDGGTPPAPGSGSNPPNSSSGIGDAPGAARTATNDALTWIVLTIADQEEDPELRANLDDLVAESLTRYVNRTKGFNASEAEVARVIKNAKKFIKRKRWERDESR